MISYIKKAGTNYSFLLFWAVRRMPFATETSNSCLPKVHTHIVRKIQCVDTFYADVWLLRLGSIFELLTFRIAKFRSVNKRLVPKLYRCRCNYK